MVILEIDILQNIREYGNYDFFIITFSLSEHLLQFVVLFKSTLF